MKKMEKNKIEEQRFEFLLRINGHIICQRYFHIKGYNEKALKSIELKDMVNNCVAIIEKDMDKKTREYIWKYYNPYVEQKEEDIERRNIFSKIDNFQFEVRIDKKTVIKEGFNGNYYPPKVRYQVDIKDIIHDIIGTIRYYLTRKEYQNFYGEENVIVEL
jgi:hypothetical protein